MEIHFISTTKLNKTNIRIHILDNVIGISSNGTIADQVSAYDCRTNRQCHGLTLIFLEI